MLQKSRHKTENKTHRLSFGIIPRNLKTEVIDFLERTYNQNGKFPGIRSLDTHIKSLGYRLDSLMIGTSI